MGLLEHIRRCAVPVAVLIGLAAPASAGAKLLMATYNEGLEPHVVLQGRTVPISNPSQLRLEISAPVQTHASVHGRFTVRCTGGGHHSTRGFDVAGVAPATRVVELERQWSSCSVIRATARYDSPFVEGWIQIRAFGTHR
jgi:hypothetical protein